VTEFEAIFRFIFLFFAVRPEFMWQGVHFLVCHVSAKLVIQLTEQKRRIPMETVTLSAWRVQMNLFTSCSSWRLHGRLTFGAGEPPAETFFFKVDTQHQYPQADLFMHISNNPHIAFAIVSFCCSFDPTRLSILKLIRRFTHWYWQRRPAALANCNDNCWPSLCLIDLDRGTNQIQHQGQGS
jgi:hypothetical protein